MDTNTLIPGEPISLSGTVIDATPEPAVEYARIEIMGHRERLGRVEEVERFGAKFVRVYFQNEDGEEIIEDYAGTAIFSICQVPKIIVDMHEAKLEKRRREYQEYLDNMRNNRRLSTSSISDAESQADIHDPFYGGASDDADLAAAADQLNANTSAIGTAADSISSAAGQITSGIAAIDAGLPPATPPAAPDGSQDAPST